MFVDLTHNYIVKNVITEKFSESVEKKLLPKLEVKYGASLLGIQMYEDYIADAFYSRGEWYYPLTVILADGPLTLWVKWRMKAGNFKDGLPYAYVGENLLEINIADEVPSEFEEKLSGRAICNTGSGIKINIETVSDDPTFLSGRYSQTFVDEMSRQLSVKISEAMGVQGIENSSISLSLYFAPDTYMQHTSENVTYRRLLLSDSASAPRDFWVKWTREDGAMAYSVVDHVNAECISFEIGEDVPQKVREKEYRFLLAAGGDKYHNAMGRKNITEWREIIRRAIRRGDLVKLEVTEDKAANDDITAALAAVLGKDAAPAAAPEVKVAEENDEFARAMAMARQIIAERETEVEESPVAEATACASEEAAEVKEEVTKIDFAPAASHTPISIFDLDEVEENEEAEEEAEDIFGDLDGTEAENTEEEADVLKELYALDGEEAPAAEALETEEEAVVTEFVKTETAAEIEARLRAEIEEKVRREFEEKAKRTAEEAAAKLAAEKEALRRQHEELIAKAEAEKLRLQKLEEARAAEEEKMRLALEEQLRREAREKERMAEAAKLALAEARREEEERKAQALAAKAEEERKAKEEAERKAAEEKAMAAKTNAAIAGGIRTKNYTYTSKTVKLLFRRSVDPNMTSRIYEVIKTTLEYYGKEKMYMRIKATIPDNTTVILEFLEIPMEEMTLLSNIIKVLGNSGLGIAKAIVD